jgi:LDH2 family malate/lactate/ureidoglycolate dehydrogenase
MNQVEALSHYRVDELRRFVVAVGVASGVPPLRAAAFASYLLWFDTAGFRVYGVNSLPDWLARVDHGELDALSEGKIETEHPGTVVLEATRGLPPLILTRAAGLAMEKARDVGIALVRVKGLAACGPFAPVVAEMAIGPEIGAIIGPDARLTVAIPSPEGLPVVIDNTLAQPASIVQRSDGKAEDPLRLLAGRLPWALFAPGEGVHVVAVAIKAFESLATFHDRVGAALREQSEANGVLMPASWDTRRREAREHGIAIDRAALDKLGVIAAKLDIALPEPGFETAEQQAH